MRLDFYYYSYQCPLNDNMIRLLEEFSDRIEVHYQDITHDFAAAKEQKIFFPTLTVLNDMKRYYSPIRRAFLEGVAQGEMPMEQPYLPPLSDRVVTKRVVPLEASNVDLACACCGSQTVRNCEKKKQFLATSMQAPYGFIHLEETGRLLGGAEYLPSMLVPYDIPREPLTAFISCVYLSDPVYDYKTAPLRALEQYLRGRYARVIAVTDEKGVFPNGDIGFFLRNGYRDEGVIFADENYCTLHLVSKMLTP